MKCPTCSHENLPSVKYCAECGARLTQHTDEPAPLDLASERRQLTVMFCDLVDSTRLSGALDPEDLRAVVLAYQEASGNVVAAYDGHVAQYLGDGILVYFGYPAAHEDSPQRAVRCALGIIEAVNALELPLPPGFVLRCRIGVHTGMVVVGDVGGGARRERLALGEVPNIAARIEASAAPGSVMISGDTHAFVQGYFETLAAGPQQFKGIARPIETFQVLKEAGQRSRFDLERDAGLAPMIGRSQEQESLMAAWTDARGGKGRVAWVSGEPGIGKSRIIQTVRDAIAAEAHERIELATSPMRQNTVLFPVTEWLRADLGLPVKVDAATAVARFESLATDLGAPAERVVPLLSNLLDVTQTAYAPLALSPQVQRELTLMLLADVFRRRAATRPLLLVVEDLHWADATTMDLLGRLRGAPGVLLLVTSRPTLVCPWRGDESVREVTLDKLSRERVAEMVAQILHGRTLPQEVLDRVLERTDGVPLFVEEQVKWLLESGFLREEGDGFVLVGELPAHAIASSLRGSLAARLDRLGPARAVAQQASVVGRTFSYDVLRAVAYEDGPVLRRELRTLVDAGLVLPTDGVDERFTFKHALIVDAAYDSLTRGSKRVHHRHLADALKARFTDTVTSAPELLAHHYTEAQEYAIAADYWKQAGMRAAAKSAYPESVAYFQKGLACVERLPPGLARDRQEVDLLINGGFSFVVTRGYGHDDVRRIYTRARELEQGLTDVLRPSERFPVAYGVWLYYLVLPEFQHERALAHELRSLAQHDDAAAFRVLVGIVIGSVSWQGELDEAREALEETIRLYDPALHGTFKDHFGQCPKTVAMANLPWTLWLQGHVREAVEVARACIVHARSINHPYSLAYALGYVAQFFYFCGDAAESEAHAAEAVRNSAEQGFPTWMATGQMYCGWARALRGEHEQGLTDVRGAQVIWGYVNVMLNQPVRLGLLAETSTIAGRHEDALRTYDEAVAFAERTGERYYLADIQRRRGELRASQGDAAGAESDLRAAYDLAHTQGARSLELRAANVLALRHRDAPWKAALAEVTGWFPADLDTPDLRAARATLAQLDAS